MVLTSGINEVSTSVLREVHFTRRCEKKVTYTSGFQKKQKQLSCIDRMLNLVETSLKMLVNEANFVKYKRLCEAHFIFQRRKV